ncbi:MAG: hypothetical protein LBC70_04505 [Chitinispirillales bacterium]|jgi:hypothetical protein|nr:hypothetical protein [Chitinispirillales bacterium]
MIPVVKQAEPADFDRKVRKLGQTFLNSCPTPKANEWKSHEYWKEINKDLYESYNRVCAYTAEWFPLSTNTISVDHFLPKSKAPHLAYEWDNFRLTTPKTNSRKYTHAIIDPFSIEVGWFVLQIPDCHIVPGDNLNPSIQAKINFTIEKLKLNLDDEHVQRRCDVILDFVKGEISFTHLQRRFPFIANELERLSINDVKTLSKLFKVSIDE